MSGPEPSRGPSVPARDLGSPPVRAYRFGSSVFARLVAVMVGVALALLLIVAIAFWLLVGTAFGSTVVRLVTDYGKALAATSPGLERAREAAARLDLEIRYEGPAGSWSTDPDVPSIESVVRAAATGGDAGSAARHDYFITPAPDGGRYLFAWGHLRRLRDAHDTLLWITFGLVGVVCVVAHAFISRSLRPLRTLHEGVARLADGELDVVLPAGTGDEFGVLTDAFNRMARSVRERVRARDQLLLDVSHELRSPLTRMKVALALLPDGEKKARMSADVAEMETMVTELLELERLRDGRGLRLARCDLGSILRDAAEAFAGVPPGVRVAPLPDLAVDVDAEKLRTVLRNLLENAAKYALPDSAPVEISAAREGESVVVRLRDDGPGIPEEDLAGVFEPFFRVDRSRSRKTGGYGLGLSICKRILEAHGGGIAVARNPGRGVTFVLTIPG